MKQFSTFLLIIAVVAMAACTGNKVTLQEINLRLDTIKTTVMAGKVDTVYTAETYKLLKQYKEHEKGDTALPKTMVRMAMALEANNMVDDCIEMLETIQQEAPNSRFAAEACLRQGFIYANVQHDYKKAEAKYKEFIEKHSKVDENLTRIASSELDNLGKTPEQLFQEMEARRKPDSVKMNVQ